jgi:hypothetical protein
MTSDWNVERQRLTTGRDLNGPTVVALLNELNRTPSRCTVARREAERPAPRVRLRRKA